MPRSRQLFLFMILTTLSELRAINRAWPKINFRIPKIEKGLACHPSSVVISRIILKIRHFSSFRYGSATWNQGKFDRERRQIHVQKAKSGKRKAESGNLNAEFIFDHQI